MCTSTNASRQRPRLINLSACSGSAVGMASYPMLATSDVSISSCPGSSSRMQGISDVFGAINSAVLIAPKTSLMPCILDDDPGQLEMLTSLVASMGYEAIPTADPEQALKLIKRGRCRLALVDVHMPAMDGYEFLSQALQSDPGVHILLMTGDYTLDS